MEDYDRHVIHLVTSPSVQKMCACRIRLGEFCGILLGKLGKDGAAILLLRLIFPVQRFANLLIDFEKLFAWFTRPCQIEQEQRHK